MKKIFLLHFICFTYCNLCTAQMGVLVPETKPKPTVRKAVKREKATKTTTPVTADKPKKQYTGSYIIVFRENKNADSYGDYDITIDGRKICRLSKGKYFKYPVAEGKHEIKAVKSDPDGLQKEITERITTKPGTNNYVNCIVRRHLRKETLKVAEVRENSGKKVIIYLNENNCH